MWSPPIWTTVAGARRYAVSDRGHVRNHAGLLVQHINDEGYWKIRLVYDDGVRREVFVHRLVACAFLPPPAPEQRYVLHGNRCRTDSCASNLRWGTHHDNHRDKIAHGTIAPVARKLLPRDIRAIRRSHVGAAKLARKLGLSISHVRETRNGRKWKRQPGARRAA